jgi:hypothetical protein
LKEESHTKFYEENSKRNTQFGDPGMDKIKIYVKEVKNTFF